MATKKSTKKGYGYTEEGWEDFELKKEWFNQNRKVHSDISLETIKKNALDQIKRMNAVSVNDFAVNEWISKKEFELISPRKQTVSIKATKNPNSKNGFGFASNAVVIKSKGKLTNTRLVLSLHKDASSKIAVSTVRIFRFDETIKSWMLVSRSGVSTSNRYAWADVYSPGIYIALGLPLDIKIITAILKLYSVKSLLYAAQNKNKLSALIKELGKEKAIQEYLSQLEKEDDYNDFFQGLTKVKGKEKKIGDNLPGLPDFDFRGRGLPEFDILDDICPPWKGRRFNDLFPIEIPEFQAFFWPILWGWRTAGPKNINGRIKSLAIHPTNPDILYAGAADGGVWKSSTGGESWKALWFQQESMAIGSIAIARSNPAIMYAATGEDTPGWGPSYPGAGVFKSIDDGVSWSPTGNGPGSRCSKIQIHPNNSDTVFVASNAGLYKTIDGGITWTLAKSGHVSDVVINQNSPNIVYAAIWNDRIYKSINGGITFADTSEGIPFIFRNIRFRIGQLPTGVDAEWIKLTIGINGANGGEFLVAKMGIDSGTLYETTNGGVTWFPYSGSHAAASYNEWTNMVAVHPSNQNRIFAAGVGMKRSTDGGNTFTNTSGTHSDHHVFVFHPNNSSICYVATDGGVYKSTNNGANWTLKSYGLTATQLYSIGVAQSGSFIMGSGTQDQGVIKTNGSLDWSDTNAGNEGGIFIVDPNNSNNIYATPWSHNLRRSTNGGTSWTDIRNGMAETADGELKTASVKHLAVKPANSNLLLAVGKINENIRKIYRSTNQGNNWSSVFTLNGYGTKVVFSPSNPVVCYVSCDNGRVFKSSSSGISGSWAEPYLAANKPTINSITEIAVGWSDHKIVVIGCSGFGGERVMRSLNGGSTWVNISGTGDGQLPNLPINGVVIDQHNTDTMYIANDVGIFRTTDGGISWHDFGDGYWTNDIPRIIVSELVLKTNTNTLYASTMGRGAYKRRL